MTIKNAQNKRNGPGGSTRRLHHVYHEKVWLFRKFWGRNSIDVRNKGAFFVRGGSAVTGLFTHANTQVSTWKCRKAEEEAQPLAVLHASVQKVANDDHSALEAMPAANAAAAA